MTDIPGESLRDILGEDHRSKSCSTAETVCALFAYLFRRITQAELVRYLKSKDGTKDRAKRIINKTRDSGYVLKNCKLYSFAHYLHHIGRAPKPKRKDFGVHVSDARILSKVNLDHLPQKHLSKSWVVKTGNGAWTPHMFDAMIENTLLTTKFDQHIGKFISKKLLFLTKHYGERRDSLTSELRAAALRAAQVTYPRFDSLLHFENAMKSSIHNVGQSKIQYHTTESRNALYKDEQGMHQAVHAGEHELEHLISPDGYMSHIRESMECLVALEPKLGPGAKRFLTIACGHYDEAFSAFLNVADNSKAVDSMSYDRYLTSLRKFLGVEQETIDQMFKDLREYL